MLICVIQCVDISYNPGNRQAKQELPPASHEGMQGAWRYSWSCLLSSALDGDEGSTACLSSLCLGKQPFVPPVYEVLWAQSQYGHFGEWNNVLPIPGIQPWIVQHVPQLL